MKILLAIFFIIFSLSCSDSKQHVPKKIPIQVIDSSWKQLENGVFVKENMQYSDYNQDGEVDYFRLQDPPGSYQHWVWLDTDYDGYFDTFIGNSEEIKGIKIPVPKKN